MLNFEDGDFFHLAGLHYLKDIQIPKNKEKTIENILEKQLITDSLICKSQVYQNPTPDLNIQSRINELSFLEQHLDSKNFIRIYQNNKNSRSFIHADYFIESQLSGHTTYIFIAKRSDGSGYYRVNSIFEKGSLSYSGANYYWMLKEKIAQHEHSVLLKHKDYIYK